MFEMWVGFAPKGTYFRILTKTMYSTVSVPRTFSEGDARRALHTCYTLEDIILHAFRYRIPRNLGSIYTYIYNVYIYIQKSSKNCIISSITLN